MVCPGFSVIPDHFLYHPLLLSVIPGFLSPRLSVIPGVTGDLELCKEYPIPGIPRPGIRRLAHRWPGYVTPDSKQSGHPPLAVYIAEPCHFCHPRRDRGSRAMQRVPDSWYSPARHTPVGAQVAGLRDTRQQAVGPSAYFRCKSRTG